MNFKSEIFSLHKFNSLNSSKAVRRFYCNKSNVKSSKNHYDTLKITPHATQNEVKSAYYKLSLQYHPDKNKSGYAKQKFHDISEAYEVLGNHALRKNYDRDTMIYREPIYDRANTAQRASSRYKETVYSGNSRIYNFDQWTEAHYGKQMDMMRMRKHAYEEFKEMEKLNRKEREFPVTLEIFILLIVIIAVVYMNRNIDTPKNKNHIQESGNKRN